MSRGSSSKEWDRNGLEKALKEASKEFTGTKVCAVLDFFKQISFHLLDKVSLMQDEINCLKEDHNNTQIILAGGNKKWGEFKKEKEGLTQQLLLLKEENEALKKELEQVQNMQGAQDIQMKEFHEKIKEDKEEKEKWIDVVKRGTNGTLKKDTISATFEEKARREMKAKNVIIRGLEVGSSPKEDAASIIRRVGVDLVCESAWRVGKDETRDKPLVVRFKSIDERMSFVAKRNALKGTRIYIDEDLTQLQMEQRREGMVQVMEARRQGKWAVFRDGRVIIRDKRES